MSLVLGLEILAALFGMGVVLGFVGAGGAGLVIAVLTLGFGIPIHLALGTSLAAMTFTTISGAVSHFREGNVNVRMGLCLGVFGMIGAFLGTKIAVLIPGSKLHYLTGFMLILSAVIIAYRVYCPNSLLWKKARKQKLTGLAFWGKCLIFGLFVGLLSGTFGIGSTPFIQVVLLIAFGLPLYIAVGTTMLVIFPIAIAGGVGYFIEGALQFWLLAEVVVGLVVGAYIGAKFTRRAPQNILKFIMVVTPAIGGVLLFI